MIRNFGLRHFNSSFERLGAYMHKETGAFDTVHSIDECLVHLSLKLLSN